LSTYNCQVKIRNELSGGYMMDTDLSRSNGYLKELGVFSVLTNVGINL
jgi:hypothetical protein